MPPSTASILREIAQKLRDNQLILFVGSGMSAPYFPTWSNLVDNLRRSAFDGDPDGAAEVDQMIKDKQFLPAAWAIQEKAGDTWRGEIESTFSGNPRANTTAKQIVERRYHALRGLPFLSFVTTNYDDFLVGALGKNAITHADGNEVAGMPGNHKLLKLHGDANKPDTLILTSTDFSTMKFDRAAVDKFIRLAAEHYSFLFLGYSFEDEDVLWWLERASYETKGKVKGHYGLIDGTLWKPYKRELYRKRFGITMIDATLGSNGFPDIETFLNDVHAEYQRSVATLFARTTSWQEQALYVDPQIQLRSDKSIHSLDTFLTEWLASEDGSRPFLVILGEFGTGKTQFSYRACELIEKHCQHRAPVLIKLGEFRNGADPAAIAAASPNRQRFQDANRDGALVLILDAFDEMGKADPKQTLDESFTRLTEGLIEGNAKVILTCRKEFFRSDDEVDHFHTGLAAAAASGKVIAASAEKVEIQLFDRPRIELALERRNRSGVLKEIENNPRLMDLARRPVLLDLIAQYDRPFDSRTKLADLYEDYIRNELRRGPDDKRANQRRRFAEKIAWRIQKEGPLPATEIEAPLKAMGFIDEADRFRSRSLLVREVNDYVFGHASFREYLVAKQVLAYLQRGEYKECKLSDPTIQFIREMWTWTPPARPVERDGMIQIPAGPFIFGEGDSARVANIDLPFWIDKYPVTNQQYLDFLHSVGRENIDKRWIRHSDSRITAKLTLENERFRGHPVTGISWFGAKAYAESPSVGKRLPTDEEWEKAARGMDGRTYPWGADDSAEINEFANTQPSGIRGTSPVTKYGNGKSPFGVFDMAGNVWEWTASAEGGSKGLRGGSWSLNPVFARCAYRFRNHPENSNDNIGFRCART